MAATVSVSYGGWTTLTHHYPTFTQPILTTFFTTRSIVMGGVSLPIGASLFPQGILSRSSIPLPHYL